MDPAFNEENLVLRNGVRLTTSVRHPSGSGNRDPHVLLNLYGSIPRRLRRFPVRRIVGV